MRRLALTAFQRSRNVVVGTWYTTIFRFRLWLNGASVGRDLRVTGPINLYVHRNGKLVIGDRCRFNSGFAVNPVGGEGRMGIWVNAGATLEICDGAGISNATIVAFQSVTVGRDAFVGGGVRVYDTDFHALDPDERIERTPGTVRTAPVVLGDRSFIGGHSIVMKGVTVGEEAVIGAGSIVLGNVPAREIWAGNPARVVRKL